MAEKISGTIKAIIIVFLAICAVADEVDPDYNYDDFMRQFGRTYQGEKKNIHEKIFNQKYAQLLKLKAEGHELAVNQFLDWTKEQEDAFFNYRPEKLNIPLSVRPLTSDLLFASAPTEFDWRNYGRVTPAKDQEGCGSCWAFSATAHYESLLAMGNNGAMYDLAEQYALQCETISSGGCNGGSPNKALKLFADLGGIPLQTQYPYNYSTNYTDICNSSTSKVALNQTIAGVYYYSSMTVDQLKQDLYTYGPINVGVYASDPGFTGSTGLITCIDPYHGINHAVLLVGYTKTHWIIKNSWGRRWGTAGFGYINMTAGADCKMLTYINQMRVNFDVSPSPNPTPNPPDPTNSINLTIAMTDKAGDGWQESILAVRQNNVIAGLFGGDFTAGHSYGPVNITVQGNIQTQIVIYRLGSYSKQIGFSVTAPNGTIIFQQFPNPTTNLPSGIIFTTFCPLGDCPVIQTVKYYVFLNDSDGDGWNGNYLGFKQQGVIVGTFNLPSGSSAGPIEFTFKKYEPVNITVYILGTWTQECGFVIRNAAGATVLERLPGSKFYADSILGSFCPECVNLSPVQIVSEPEEQEIQDQKIVQKVNKSYIIATYVLVAAAVILGIALGLTVFKYAKLSKQMKQLPDYKVPESAKSISSVEVQKNI